MRYLAQQIFAALTCLMLGSIIAITHSAQAQVLIIDPKPGDVIISEFRFHGTTGPTDEFIELYNTTNGPIVVNAPGWTLSSSDGVALVTIPAGTQIPAHAHYLVINETGFSLGDYPAGETVIGVGDISYKHDIPDNAGVALFATTDPAGFTLANRLDAVGFSNVTDEVYIERTGIAGFPDAKGEYSLVRRLTSGVPQDTDDNNNDFIFIATDGDTLYGTDSNVALLGAPGPESTQSPIQRNAAIKTSLIDNCAGTGLATPVGGCQSRVRMFTPDANNPTLSPNGQLLIRRKFTNATRQTISRLRFRIIDVTTQGSQPAGQADLRVLSSKDITVVRADGGGTMDVKGLTLEQPPAQQNGGGLNSTLAAGIVTTANLAPNASIAVEFRLGIVQGGSYRFLINIEALTSSTIISPRDSKATQTKFAQGRSR